MLREGTCNESFIVQWELWTLKEGTCNESFIVQCSPALREGTCYESLRAGGGLDWPIKGNGKFNKWVTCSGKLKIRLLF